MTGPDDLATPDGGGEPRETRSGGDVHFHFPVHVTVVGGLTEADRELLQDEVLDRLHRALS